MVCPCGIELAIKTSVGWPDSRSVSAFSINTDLAGLRARGTLGSIAKQVNQAIEHLATGKRLNRASDDPSGITTVDALKVRLTEVNKRLERLDFTEHYLGARDGAEAAVADLLLQLQSSVTTSANTGGLTQEEREAIQGDAVGIIKAIDYLAQNTTFNGQQILTGFTAKHLGVAGLDLVEGDREAAQQAVTAAIKGLGISRAAIGTQVQGIQSERRQLQTELENTEAARSLIEDADFAQETASLIRAQTLQDANLFILQLATEQKKQMVESLLTGAGKS